MASSKTSQSTTRNLKPGDIILIEKGMKVTTDVPEYFVFSNRKRSFKLTSATVEVGKDISGYETSYLEGVYIVDKVSDTPGGGVGMGEYRPDYTVWCIKHNAYNETDFEAVTLSFNQIPAYCDYNKFITILGKAEKSWILPADFKPPSKKNQQNES